MTTRGDFRAAVTLNGTLEACRYKGARFFVAASFQLAMIAIRVGMSLEASGASCGSPEVRYDATGMAII